MIALKLLLLWLVMVACAISNGIIRENVLNRHLDEKMSLLVSGLSLSVLVFIVSYVGIDFLEMETASAYVLVGVFWVMLTLVFEYGFGYYVRGKSWLEINQVFNVEKGNLFIVVLFVTAAAPLISAYLKGYL